MTLMNCTQRYDGGAFPEVVLDRVMRCAPSLAGSDPEVMSYFAFVTLMLADADKEHRSAVPFWFRVLDLDDDGVISRHEIQTVYLSMRQHLVLIGVCLALAVCMIVVITQSTFFVCSFSFCSPWQSTITCALC